MKDNSYFPLRKRIQQHWIWDDKPFAKGQAWIDLLMMANYADGEVLSKGAVIPVKRGQVFRTIKFLSDRWGWSDKKTLRFLKLLESQKMAICEGTPHGTCITIANYSFWNDEGIQADIQDGTSRGYVGDTRVRHNNKNIRINNNKTNSASNAHSESTFEHLWSNYPVKRGKSRVSAATKRKIADIGEEQMARALARYKKDLEADQWRKPQNGSTWFNGGYVDYLDDNYEPPKEIKEAPPQKYVPEPPKYRKFEREEIAPAEPMPADMREKIRRML